MTYLNLRILGAEVFPVAVDAAQPIVVESQDCGFIVLPLRQGVLGSVKQDQLGRLNRGDLLVFTGKARGFLATTNDLADASYMPGSRSADGTGRHSIGIDHEAIEFVPDTSRIKPLAEVCCADEALDNTLAIVLKIQLCEIMKGGMGDTLPEYLHLSPAENRQAYIASIGEQLAQISDSVADIRKAKIVRFTELLLIEALDLYVNIDSTKSRLIRGNKDLRIGEAIRAIHENPAYKWTVSGLAGVANMSRSLFANKFKETFGETPLNYVKQCRIDRAKVLLTESVAPLEQIADQCGYTSQSAFIKAFSTSIGYSPGRWRAMQKKQ